MGMQLTPEQEQFCFLVGGILFLFPGIGGIMVENFLPPEYPTDFLHTNIWGGGVCLLLCIGAAKPAGNKMRKYVAIMLVFWGAFMDLILSGGSIIRGMGNCAASGFLSGRLLRPCDATKLDGLLMLYVFLLSGIIRIYAGLYPNHTGCWQAGMLSMVFEIVLTYQAYAIKGEVDFSDPAFIRCGITFCLMLITYPSSSGPGEKDKSN